MQERFAKTYRAAGGTCDYRLFENSVHEWVAEPGPQTDKAREVVKERAKRLRERGAAALARHLDGEVGARRRVLMETREVGRTEQFTLVRLASPAEPGTILGLTIAGHDGRQLLAA